MAQQGERHDVPALYKMGKLYADLPPDVGVLTVQAAAETSLRGRGYVVTDSGGTKDRAYVTAKSYIDGKLQWLRVDVATQPAATRINIESGLFGDEVASRGVLDGILGRLGR